MTVTGDPVDRIHKDFYPAHDHGGPRSLSIIDWVVLHDPEGLTAEGTGHTFDAIDGRIGSAHIGTDDDTAQLYLPDAIIAYGAVGANEKGVHVEISGFAQWSTDEWMSHESNLERAAYWVRQWCVKYKIPMVYLTAPDLKAGKRGITTHHQVEVAWPSYGHYDPGPGFPIAHFIDLVNAQEEDVAEGLTQNQLDSIQAGGLMFLNGDPKPDPNDHPYWWLGWIIQNQAKAPVKP